MEEKEKNSLNFNFDISAFRLIGRELITDKITAVFELVKNSYDANAEKVEIEFHNVQSEDINTRKIIIRDDGKGMSFSDVKNKWMVIGTDNKRTVTVSDAPYNRRLVGKKGIGRFAVDKLGDTLVLKTKQLSDNEVFCLENDWSNYVKLEKEQIMETIEQEMREAAKSLDFERAMELRDILFEMKSN